MRPRSRRLEQAFFRSGPNQIVPFVDPPEQDRTAIERPDAVVDYLKAHMVLLEGMNDKHFPPGWDEDRVQRVLEHYDGQSDDEAVAEDEAAFERTTHTVMEVPVDLVPAVRELIAKRKVS